MHIYPPCEHPPFGKGGWRTAEARAREAEVAQRDDVTAQFEAVAAVLAELDVEAVWLEATRMSVVPSSKSWSKRLRCSRIISRSSWPGLRA